MCPRDLLLACFVFAGSPQSSEQPHMLGPRSAKELLDAHDAYVNDVQTNGSAPTLGEQLACAPSAATTAHVCGRHGGTDLTGAVTDTSAGGVAYPRSLQQGAPRPAHIPSYMPPLPEPHTYSHTKVGRTTAQRWWSIDVNAVAVCASR